MKRDAVRRALPDARVERVAVESGVSEQPWGDDETVAGARNRAQRALGDAHDLGVGLEGGVCVADWREATEQASSDGEPLSDRSSGRSPHEDGDAASQRPGDLHLIMWAAATDGDRTEIGAGPRLRLPDDVADRLHDGAELGPVMDDLLDTSGVAENQGAAGVLTAGMTDRTEALRTAVAGAVGPFVTEHY